jgi:hypothetical protein
MSISSLSFWQQDYNWRVQQSNWSQQLSNSNAFSSVMATALSSQSQGLASIANNQALIRVTKQLTDAATAALQGSSGTSDSGSSTSAPTVLSASSGLLPSASLNLQSAGTAETLLSSVLSAQSSSTGGLAGILNAGVGNVVNLFA